MLEPVWPWRGSAQLQLPLYKTLLQRAKVTETRSESARCRTAGTNVATDDSFGSSALEHVVELQGIVPSHGQCESQAKQACQARQEQAELTQKISRGRDSRRGNRTATSTAALYYLHHMRSCATSAWGATRRSGSTAGHFTSEGCRWLNAVLSIFNTAVVCLKAFALLLCAVGVLAARR